MTSSLSISAIRTPFQTIRARAESGKSKPGGFIDSSIFNTGTDFLQQGLGVGLRVTKVVFGLLGVAGGAVLAAIFKEHTAADYGSKVLMIAGAILGALGVKDLMSFNKSIQSKIEPPKCNTAIDETVGKECKKAIAELSKPDLDPLFAKPVESSNLGIIRTNESNADVRKSAIELLKVYTKPELVTHAATYKSGLEYTITNIDNEPVPLAVYSDRLAKLVGYVSASGNLDAADVDAKAVVETVLNNLETGTTQYSRILPTDFVDTYSAAKWYRENYSASDSITTLIGGDAEITELQNAVTNGTISPATKEYLDKIQKAQNYLTALDRVISYVQNPDNLADPVKNPIKARNVIILRQALICGLGLKGASAEQISAALSKFHTGEVGADGNKIPGIQGKLKKINEFLKSEKIREIIDKETFPMKRSSTTISGDDVLGGMVWYEFLKKNPTPVAA